MIVIDCSAALSLFLNQEEGSSLRDAVLSGEKILAPNSFCSELVQMLSSCVSKGYFDAKTAQLIATSALEMVDEYFDDDLLRAEVLNEACRLKCSSFNLFYFVLARRSGATLLTLNEELIALCKTNGMEVITDKS